MRAEFIVNIQDIDDFKQKIITYGNNYNQFAFLDSNNYNLNNTTHTYYKYDFIAGIGSLKEILVSNQLGFDELHKFQDSGNDWLFGYFTYDLKNELENLESNNIDELNFPSLHFFNPKIVIISTNAIIKFLYHAELYTENEIKEIIEQIKNQKNNLSKNKSYPIELKKRFDKSEYLQTVLKLKDHIQQGDIYEINFCQEFYSNSCIDPVNTYNSLNQVSPSPFSCYYKLNDHYLLCASPERFLKKIDHKIISQPIKGTIRRSSNVQIDLELKDKLRNDPKEQAENVMIVDLVRNDLSHTAKKGSVKVDELFGVYSFKQVHQMISTVISEVENYTPIVNIIKSAFPMGSMTGAPKVRAMKLIEKYEKTKRGLYSGSIGYITPEKDFDFNVVIRSILYNQTKKYLSFAVGGAITSLANPENEYEECMLKAEAMLKVLS